MSQAVRDLPDPLQPAPVLPSSSPDDLLAKMADEAIDKLMADADKGTIIAPPASAVDLAARDAAAAIDEVTFDIPREPEPAPPPPAPVEPVAAAETPVEPRAGLTEQPVEAVTAPTQAETPPAPPADVKALLAESSAGEPSVMLLPLRLINAPFAWMGDGTRTFVGLLGLVTLVPAACAVVWVLFMKGK